MASEKEIAEVVERCYTGKASEQDLSSLLEHLLQNSTLGKNINGNLPEVFFHLNEEKSEHIIKYGNYDKNGHIICLNENMIDDVKKGKDRSLFQLIDTYGHEMTHHYQYLKGELESKETAHFKQENVKAITEATGVKMPDKNYFEVSHGEYLKLPHEEGAREGGAAFVLEAFKHLLTNPYLNKNIKEKVENDLKYVDEYVEQSKIKDQYYYKQHDGFIRYLKQLTFEEFLNDRCNKKDIENSITDAMDVWLEAQSPDTIIESYVKLIGSGEEYSTVRDKILKSINSDSFPKNIRDNMISRVYKALHNPNIPEYRFEKELQEILSKEQILDVYEYLLQHDVKNIDCPLFTKYKLDPDFVQVFVKNLEKTVLNSRKDAEVLKKEMFGIIFTSDVNGIDDKNLKKLEEAHAKLSSKLNVQEEKKTVR